MSYCEMLEDSSETPYYLKHGYSEELGLVEYERIEQTDLRKQWSKQTTLWLLVLAILLWTFTYVMIMTITMCFDISFRSVAGVTGIINWFNGTTAVITEDRVRFIRLM